MCSRNTYAKAVAASLAVLFGAAYASDSFEMSRYTIDGGGQMRCAGGEFELSGTIGQPDAGLMAGGTFELSGGFWFALPSGDCNEDGIVGLPDAGAFANCITGPDSPILDDSCRCFDIDRNKTVDTADFAALQASFMGQ